MAERLAILWSPAAASDLEEIVEYAFAHDGPEVAESVHRRIMGAVGSLVRHPARCRIVPELREVGSTAYRELVLRPYGVFFRIGGRKVRIVAALDRRRDRAELLLARVLRVVR